MGMIKHQRKFGGKVFNWYSSQHNIKDARRIADGIRFRGNCARVTKLRRGYYMIWKGPTLLYGIN